MLTIKRYETKTKQNTKTVFPHCFFPSLSFTPPFPIPLPPPSHIPTEQHSGRRMDVALVHYCSSLPFLPSHTSSCSCMGLYPGLLSLRINLLQCGSHVQAHSFCQGPAFVRALHGCSFLWATSTCASVEHEYLLQYGPPHKLQGNSSFPMVFSRLCREHLIPLSLTFLPSLLTLEQ